MTARAGTAPRAFLQVALRALCDADTRGALATACADADLDWSAVCDLADTERVAPLLHLALRDKESVAPVPLALHWSLFDSPYYQYALNMDWFWETAEAAEIADTHARMLGPEAQVLHLCGHLRLDHGGAALVPLYYPYRWLRALRGAR